MNETDFAGELAKISKQVNEIQDEEPGPPDRDDEHRAEFARIGEKSCAGMIQAMQNAVNEAQSELEKTRLVADEIRAKINEREAALDAMTKRHRTLGMEMLAAARKCLDKGD